MGNAFVAIADDVHALYYNPAGLVRIQRPEFTGSYGKLYLGTTDDNSNLGSGFVGLASPLKKFGSLGFSWANFSLANAYQENSFTFAYAKNILGDLALGASLKRFSVDFTQDGFTRKDPVFDFGKRDSASAVSFDLGLITRPFPALSFGFSLMNINQPDISLRDGNKVPLEFKSALAWYQRSSVVAIDGGVRGKHFTTNIGGEKWFWKHTFAARIGAELGDANLRNFASGLSYNLGSFQVDYAFLFPAGGLSSGAGSHRMGITLRFGPDPEIKAEQERERLRLIEVQKALEQRKEDFYNRGLNYFNGSDFEIAILQWEEALKIDPNHKPSMTGIAQAKVKIQEREEASKKQLQDLIDSINALKQQVEASQEKQIQTEEKLAHERARLALQEAQARKAQFEAQRLKAELERKAKVETAEKETKKAGSRVTSYRVVPGESLQSIAEKIYNDPNRWQDIYNANKDKIRRGSVEPGQVLVIP